MMVLDTHSFLWYCLDDPALPPATKLHLSQNTEAVFVPSIVIWEIVMLAQKGRLNIGSTSPDQFARGLLSRSRFKEVPLNSEIAILSRILPFHHEDPADRFIAATAHFLRMPLVTEDKSLTGLSWLNTI
ncbi:MAG: type II toxin-antitoxin system VapC family toxin [Armatimonadetes bacterium]|nr:type II toxin-antitoxin system VapC family toxin [Armatimonadota bacterium]